MNRSITSTCIILFAVLMLSCSEEKALEEIPDKSNSTNMTFRQSNWGMTPDEVKSTETGKPITDDENVVLYRDTYLDMPAQMGYVFKDGKLIKGAYLFEQSFENPDEYIVTYEKVKSSLINEFGPPSLDEIKWLDKNEADESSSGQSICEGKVVYRSEWVELDTIIVLLLEGADDKCRQGVIFESKSNFLIENQKVDTPN